MLARMILLLGLLAGAANANVIAEFPHTAVRAQAWDADYAAFLLQDGRTHTASISLIEITATSIRIHDGGDVLIWILPSGQQVQNPQGGSGSNCARSSWTDASGTTHEIITQMPDTKNPRAHSNTVACQLHRRRVLSMQRRVPPAPVR